LLPNSDIGRSSGDEGNQESQLPTFKQQPKLYNSWKPKRRYRSKSFEKKAYEPLLSDSYDENDGKDNASSDDQEYRASNSDSSEVPEDSN